MALGRQVRQALLLACAFGIGYEFFGAPPNSSTGDDAWPTPLPPQPLPPPPPPTTTTTTLTQSTILLPPPPPLPAAPPTGAEALIAKQLPSESPPAVRAPQPAVGSNTVAQVAADAPVQRRSGAQTSAAEIDMWKVAPTLSMENRYNPPRQSRGVGSWTQGWDINVNNADFEGGEKLEIYVVPHSHNDPGWKETFEEWYSQKTGKVLDTMVRAFFPPAHPRAGTAASRPAPRPHPPAVDMLCVGRRSTCCSRTGAGASNGQKLRFCNFGGKIRALRNARSSSRLSSQGSSS